jgi:hypothetical protein
MKEATMTIRPIALLLLCLMNGTAVAQEPKVTSLMSKDLAENPGRELLMITVGMRLAGRARSTDTMRMPLFT